MPYVKISARKYPPGGLTKGRRMRYNRAADTRIREIPMNHIQELKKKNRRNTVVIIAMLISVILLSIACLFAGSSNMSFTDALDALVGKGTAANVRII